MSVKWPVGAGTKFNIGVTTMVQDISGSIGYVSLPYAIENKMPVASIKNKAKKFIAPTLKSTIASAKIQLPADSRIAISDTPVGDGYPITGFTWILLNKDAEKSKMTLEEAKALKKLMIWMLTEGQVYADFMNYAPLPIALVKPAIEQVNKMTYKGQTIPE
jgi:phosphate transport system substrate-binding protein